MAHKTLTISEEAYEALANLKKEGESFTELIKRITAPLRKKKLSEFAGKIKDEQFVKAALEVRHHPSRFTFLFWNISIISLRKTCPLSPPPLLSTRRSFQGLSCSVLIRGYGCNGLAC